MTSLHMTQEIVFSELFRTGLFQTMREGCSSNPTTAVASPKERLYEQMTSNPAFTERNIQKANAYLLYSRQEQKSLVTYHTLQSLYVCVSLVNTLISTAPIGSPIMCNEISQDGRLLGLLLPLGSQIQFLACRGVVYLSNKAKH